jgi:cytochrome b subunit of formate dehydrogenase
MRQMSSRKKRPISIFKVAEFNFAWLIVLMTGLIIFYDIPELRKDPIGQGALILYLTGTIYHTIQAIPSFTKYIHIRFIKKEAVSDL